MPVKAGTFLIIIFVLETMIDKKLLSILVCPVSKGALTYHQQGESDSSLEELRCKLSGLAYPIRDSIPVMLEAEAREMSSDEIAAL